MANSPQNKNRLTDGGFQFTAGVNSLQDPQFLPDKAVAWAINMVNRTGSWELRGGYHSIARLADGRAQGFTIFTPSGGIPNMVAAVSGRIWVSSAPFTSWSMLPNIQFSEHVDHIAFQEALQSVNNGAQVEPRNMLFMQDGTSRCAFWDGSENRHTASGNPQFETPVGLWMAYIGGRLWLMRGPEIFASDIYDPLHFTETTYLSGGGSLMTLDGSNGTGLARTADNKSLVAFTEDNTTVIAASVTDRSLWPTTPGFISILFPGVGCASGKSITYASNGELCWFSKQGARRFTQVGSTIQTSRNDVASLEIDRSFRNLSPVLSRVCAFAHDGYVGFSVPSGDIYNRHTWVLDLATQTSSVESPSPAWQGIWMGTRPVEWAVAQIGGEERCFHLAQDTAGVYVWEAFQSDQMDDVGRIYYSLETKGMVYNELTSFKKFLYSEFHIKGVRGRLDVSVHVRSEYTCWVPIAERVYCAEDCHQLACNAVNQAASAQCRFLKTEELQNFCPDPQIGPYSGEIGTYFQNRIRGYGRFGLSKFRSFANQFQESSTGECADGDYDADGNLECKSQLCCDMEIDYVSIPITPYGSNTSLSTVGSV